MGRLGVGGQRLGQSPAPQGIVLVPPGAPPLQTRRGRGGRLPGGEEEEAPEEEGVEEKAEPV